MSMTNWRGPADWNADLESGASMQRFMPADLPIDLLDEDVVVHRPTPTVHAIESFDVGEDIGRYVPLPLDAVPVGEGGAHLSLEPGGGLWLHDPALDEFFGEARFEASHAHGPLGTLPFELQPVGLASDDVSVTPAADAEALVDAFIALPHHEAFALPTAEGMDVFGAPAKEMTFGGGDDPLWMLTLLPSPDDFINDTGFGHPGLGFDPWG